MRHYLMPTSRHVKVGRPLVEKVVEKGHSEGSSDQTEESL